MASNRAWVKFGLSVVLGQKVAGHAELPIRGVQDARSAGGVGCSRHRERILAAGRDGCGHDLRSGDGEAPGHIVIHAKGFARAVR